MSESTFPFGAPAEDAPAGLDEETADSRKPLLVVGAIVGALALGASAFLFLGGGSDDEELALAVAPRTPPASTATAEPQAVAVIPAASSETVGRNPFRARYVAPAGAAGGAGGAAAEPTAPAPTVEQPTFMPLPSQQPVVVVQQPAPAPAATPAPAPSRAPAPAEYPITLTAVEPTGPSGITYTWTVEGKDVDVFQAQRFGRYGELTVLALETGADGVVKAVLQVGDASPIRVAVGETVNVL